MIIPTYPEAETDICDEPWAERGLKSWGLQSRERDLSPPTACYGIKKGRDQEREKIGSVFYRKDIRGQQGE